LLGAEPGQGCQESQVTGGSGNQILAIDSHLQAPFAPLESTVREFEERAEKLQMSIEDGQKRATELEQSSAQASRLAENLNLKV
jgi:hypothetical protein